MASSKTVHYSQNEAVPEFLRLGEAGENYAFRLHAVTDRFDTFRKRYGSTKPSRRNVSNAYEILLVRSGKGKLDLDNRQYDIHRGMLMLVEPDSERSYCNRRIESLDGCYLRFSFVIEHEKHLRLPIQEIFSRWGGCNISPPDNPLFLPQSKVKYCEDIFAGIMAQQLPHHYYRWFELHEAICRLFSFMIKEVYHAASPAENDKSPANMIRCFVEERLHEKITLGELAKEANLSISQMSRIFNHAFGMPPIEYQNTLKIEKAKHLLRTTDMPIAEIAEMLGFCSPFHFSRYFRKRAGLSPTYWRNNEQSRS